MCYTTISFIKRNGHVLTHLKTKPFLCKVPDCYKSYCDSRSLKRHIELKHQHVLADLLCGNNNAREYLPPIDAIYVNINANVHRICLQSNIMTSPDKDVFKKLSEMLSQSNDTALHFSFDEPKPIPCPSCNKSFKSMPALYGHMRLHRGYSNAINVIKLKTNYERNTSNPDAKSLFKEDINITLNSSTQKHTSSSGKQCTIDVEATSADRPKHIQKLKESNLLLNKMTPLFLSSYTVNSESSNEILSMVKDDQQCKEEKQVEKFRKHNRSKANCYMLSNDVRNMPTEPCINIGSKFQADIPEIDYGDSNDRETLLWTPRCITDKNICWQAVNDYLSFAQSAIHQKAPYSLELALYILCKCEGDMFSAMNVLLSGSIEIKANDSIFQTCLQDITLFPYSSSWTTKEIQQFLKTLQSVGTDFRTISEAVQTKSSKECVELYYLWKNLRSRYST
ncbi:hypothetical protein GJ496_012066 [Pomphorhynchus laevis]|nr:hypothetical protein GJ496_012066 [Pomphorhynchus laevis]